MLGETLKVVAPEGAGRNAINESRVLHARNLCDFCNQPWRPTDIKPIDLFDDYDNAAEYSALRGLVADVAIAYITDACMVVAADGTSTLKVPNGRSTKCWLIPPRTEAPALTIKLSSISYYPN